MTESFLNKWFENCSHIILLIFISPIIILIIFVIIPVLFISSWIQNRKVGTTFAFKNTRFNRKVQKNISLNVGHYQPPWWYNNHVGTLIQFGKLLNLPMERDIYSHADGTSFAVDWYPHSPRKIPNSTVNITLYFPGLGLSSNCNVAQYYASEVAKQGFICGIITPRGHPTSGVPLRNTKLWHAGCIDDGIP